MIVHRNELQEGQSACHSNWDTIDSSIFVPLVSIRKTTSEFGFLLRHYWIPATDLYYNLSVQHYFTGQCLSLSQTICQSMVKCDADRCVWRQSVIGSSTKKHGMIGLELPQIEDVLYEYNRSAQTFQIKSIFDFDESTVKADEARIQAFLMQPILNPLLPIPLGFHWHIKSKHGYLDFQLESLSVVNGMPVLFVRRTGKFFLDRFFQDGNVHIHRFQVEREGITAYALDRSIVLEDRVHDTIQNFNGGTDRINIWTTKRLIESRLP